MNKKLAELVVEAKSIAKKIEQVFGGLTAEQLNWKPDEKSWSVGQCLEHLIITNKLEFPAIEDALTANYQNPVWSKLPFLPTVFGKTMIYFMKPESTRKIKAPKSFQPSKSKISENIVRDFIAHQQEFIEIVKRCEDLDSHKTKIVSPISDLITYTLADALAILVVHEQRHFNQATRVLQFRGFPQ